MAVGSVKLSKLYILPETGVTCTFPPNCVGEVVMEGCLSTVHHVKVPDSVYVDPVNFGS